MRRRDHSFGVLLAALLLAPSMTAQSVLKGTPVAPDSYEARVVAAFPAYVPQQPVSGVIRIFRNS